MTMTQRDMDRRFIGGDLFVDTGGAVALRISHCNDCDSRWFPVLTTCANCASQNLEEILSGANGHAYASTKVRVGAAPFPSEYVLSYVDVDGVRLLIHTDSDEPLAPDTPVKLVVGQVAEDDTEAIFSYMARPQTEMALSA